MSLPRSEALRGAPDEVLARLPGFIQEFSSNPILPDFLYELEPELASKMPQTAK